MRKTSALVAWAAALWTVLPHAHADEASCGREITAANLARCAVRASLTVDSARALVAEARARSRAAEPFLPANPALSIQASRRSPDGFGGGNGVTNWYVTLEQELEIAGQRGARLETERARTFAQTQRLVAVRRQVVALAWTLFYEALAAEETLQLARRIEAASSRIADVARARAVQGLSANVEAELADANALQAVQLRLEAERQRDAVQGRLATALGRDPYGAAIAVRGELTPLPHAMRVSGGAAEVTPAGRAELLAARYERRANHAEADVYRRRRVPNPTLSGFVQNDGFNERVIGLGVAFPLPLPHPVGRTYAGEIEEAEARADRAAIEERRLGRALRSAAREAQLLVRTRAAQVATFGTERVARAERTIGAIAEEVAAGRLPVRDALLTQQALIDLLQSYVVARLALTVASVELAYVLGLPLEGRIR